MMENQELIAKSKLSNTGVIWLITILMVILWIISLDWSSDQKVKNQAQASQQIVFSQKYSTFAYDDFKLLKLTEKGSGLLIKLDEEKWSGWISIEGLSRRYTVNPADHKSEFYLRFDDDDKIYHITPKNTDSVHFKKRWNKATFQIKGSERTDTEDTALIKLTK